MKRTAAGAWTVSAITRGWRWIPAAGTFGITVHTEASGGLAKLNGHIEAHWHNTTDAQRDLANQESELTW